MPDALPTALEPGFDPRSDVFNRLLKNRVIMLGTDVNDEIANSLCAQLLYLEGEDANADIWLYINSPGGSVYAGMAIYDTMQFVSCDVATVCIGMAASMGQFLLTAGAAGKRYTLPNARVMMHQPLAGLRGQAADIAIQADRVPHRSAGREDPGRCRARSLVHRRRSRCLRAGRQGDVEARRSPLTARHAGHDVRRHGVTSWPAARPLLP
jgi:ATP-dependent Clp protease protease subunit